MPGTTSNQPQPTPGRQAKQSLAAAVQQRIRVTNIYATPWHLADSSGDGELPAFLKLWRFERYYRLSADQFPKVLLRETVDTSAVRFHRWQPGDRVTGARV